MKNSKQDYIVPNYLLQAMLAVVLFLLAALVLALLMFANEGDPTLPAATGETVQKYNWEQRHIVVLDAGHGGSDPGAVTRLSQDTEAAITQKIADRLYDMLEKHPEEVQVEWSHPPDTYATVQARAAVALQLRADVLVSLHLNADANPGSRGFQVYPTPPGRMHHQGSLRLAQLITQQVGQQTELPVKGASGIFYAYYHEVPGGGWRQEQIDSQWVDMANPSLSPSFGVVENTGCPAVLVEQWFITNEADMALMNREEGYDAMARSLYLALCAYLEIAPLQ